MIPDWAQESIRNLSLHYARQKVARTKVMDQLETKEISLATYRSRRDVIDQNIARLIVARDCLRDIRE